MSSHQNGKLGKIIHSKSAFWDGDTVDASEIPEKKTSWGEGSWNPIIYNVYIYIKNIYISQLVGNGIHDIINRMSVVRPPGFVSWPISLLLKILTICPTARCWATRRSVTSDLMSSWEGRGRSNSLGRSICKVVKLIGKTNLMAKKR